MIHGCHKSYIPHLGVSRWSSTPNFKHRVEGPERVDSGRLGDMDGWGLVDATAARSRSPPCRVAAAAPGADKPLAPLEDRGIGVVSRGRARSSTPIPGPRALRTHEHTSRTFAEP